MAMDHVRPAKQHLLRAGEESVSGRSYSRTAFIIDRMNLVHKSKNDSMTFAQLAEISVSETARGYTLSGN